LSNIFVREESLLQNGILLTLHLGEANSVEFTQAKFKRFSETGLTHTRVKKFSIKFKSSKESSFELKR